MRRGVSRAARLETLEYYLTAHGAWAGSKTGDSDLETTDRLPRVPVSSHVVAIQTAPVARAPMDARMTVRFVAGRGIEGDRYFAGVGAMSRWPGAKRELSLIAQEDLEAASKRANAPIPFEQTRRNVLTRGVDLRGLIGVRFRIGHALVEGVGACQPCGYLDKVAERDDLRVALKGLGGLRARIVESGDVRVGDPIGGSPQRRALPETRLSWQPHSPESHEPQQRRHRPAVQAFVVEVEAQRGVERPQHDAGRGRIGIVSGKALGVVGHALGQFEEERFDLSDVGRRRPAAGRRALAVFGHHPLVDVERQARATVDQQLLRDDQVRQIPQQVVGEAVRHDHQLLVG